MYFGVLRREERRKPVGLLFQHFIHPSLSIKRVLAMLLLLVTVLEVVTYRLHIGGCLPDLIYQT